MRHERADKMSEMMFTRRGLMVGAGAVAASGVLAGCDNGIGSNGAGQIEARVSAAMTIPDDPADLPGWLESRLVGPDLGRLATELRAVHPPAPAPVPLVPALVVPPVLPEAPTSVTTPPHPPTSSAPSTTLRQDFMVRAYARPPAAPTGRATLPGKRCVREVSTAAAARAMQVSTALQPRRSPPGALAATSGRRVRAVETAAMARSIPSRSPMSASSGRGPRVARC